MNRTERKRKADNRKKLVIIVLLLLCVAAAVYILLHSGRTGADKAEEPAEEVTAEENAEVSEEEAEEAAAKDAEAIATGKAAAHVYSHRGSAGDDELTIAAYDRAIEAGSRFIEADMVVSKDGTIFLAHDDNTFEMTGYDAFFSGMTDGQISELKTKAGNSIIKLSDLFDKYGDSVTYLIDLKYTGQRNIDAFTEIVKKYEIEDNVIAVSSYFDALAPLEETFPGMLKIIVCPDQATFDTALWKENIDILCAPKEIMTEDNLRDAHDHGKEFSVWTLNTEDEIKKAIELGVDSYFTDDSGLAISLEKELRED